MSFGMAGAVEEEIQRSGKTPIDYRARIGNLSKPIPVDRRSQLTFEQFVHEYRDPGNPVILTDAISDWPALRKWSPEFFKEHYGATLVAVDGRYGMGKQPTQR